MSPRSVEEWSAGWERLARPIITIMQVPLDHSNNLALANPESVIVWLVVVARVARASSTSKKF